MKPIRSFGWFFAFAGLLCGTFAQESVLPSRIQPTAPPPGYPPMTSEQPQSRSAGISAASTVYSIGDPTPEEQLYLEDINRARANPPIEGLFLSQATDPDILSAYDYFNVDLPLMVLQFSVIAPAQPVAFNAKLIDAARRHSQDMFQNIYQDHTGTDGSTPGTRVADSGYPYQTVAENIYATAESVFYGHAGFEVDWGNGPTSVGGMQNPPGHRNNIHNPVFKEAGVGVVLGINGTVPVHYSGPQVVTQELGTQQGAKPLITGVAYYDLNGNNFYDVGEGVGGVNVTVNGQTTSAITARSGGYAVPVTGGGTYTVTFSGGGFAGQSSTIIITNSENHKLDFIPAYVAPVVSGPAAPGTNANSTYTFTAVGGASAYQWRQFQKTPALGEGAENGNARVTVTTTGQYDPFASDVKKSGAYSFHLTHLVAGAQIVALNPVYLVGDNGSINFQSRLGWAASDEHASVQVSEDGASWTTVDQHAGSNGAGELTFSGRTASLAQFAGKSVRVRFVYDFSSGSYFPSADSGVGWYIDDISFSNVDEITNESITDTTSTSFSFKPQAIASYGLQVRAKTGHDFLPWGPTTYVQSIAAALQFALSTITKRTDGTFDLDFEIRAGTAPASFKVQGKTKITDTWADQAGTFQTISAGKYRVNVAATAGVNTRFFRIASN
jgi:hypothetical protein